MVESGKNPAELTNEDREAINQMLLICGAELSGFLDSHPPPPEKGYNKILEFIKSRNNIVDILLFFNLSAGDLCDARDLNKRLVEYTGYGIPSKDGSKKYLDNPAMSKALRKLVHENLLLRTTGKEALKKIRNLQGEQRFREYKKRYARGGFISIYEVFPDVARLRKIMSKPIVAETFHSILRKYSPFQEYIKILSAYFLYLIRNLENEEENFYELLKGVNIKLQVDRYGWEQFRKKLGSLDDKQLELVKEKMSSLMLENPLALHHVLYRLYKLPDS